MKRFITRSLCFLLLAVLIASAAPVLADVTINGTVQYYDRLRNVYKPLKNADIEVVGDWWALNPEVQTDGSGSFTATQRDPWIGDFSIKIVARARTGGMVSLFENMFFTIIPWWCYGVSSQTTQHINGGQTCTINLKVGGSYNNAVDSWARSIEETANAFLIQQEIMDHYQKLLNLGFPLDAFRDTKVIVPAAGVGPYYNHITDFVNLTESGMTGGTGFTAGTGSWLNLDASVDGFIGYPFVLETARHEVSHRINKRIALGAPLGLNIPMTHSPEMGTNIYVAYTEGFASFLPLMTIPATGLYEQTPSEFSPTALSIPTATQPDDNNEWEGEVSALFLDLVDPAGTSEPMRYPATRSADGATAPRTIREAQKWVDRLADPSCSKTRATLARVVNVVLPVDNIASFLDEYDKFYPADRHALKTIAYNRCLAASRLPENQPYLSGGITVSRRDAATVVAQLSVVEMDAEDRKFVTVYCWRENGTTLTPFTPPTVLSTGWIGSQCTLSIDLPSDAGRGASDKLWFVVSDEMRATAYTVPTPEALPPSTDPGTETGTGSTGGSKKKPWDRKFYPVKKPKLDILGPLKTGISDRSLASVQSMTSQEQQQKETEFRAVMDQAGAEILAYAQAQRTMEKSRLMLRGLARNVDGARLAEGGRFKGVPGVGTDDAALDGWLTQVAGGRALKGTVPAGMKSELTAQLKLLSDTTRRMSGAKLRAQQASTKLQAAFSSLSFAGEAEWTQTSTKAAVETLQKRLLDCAADSSVPAGIQKQAAALKTLSAR